MSSLKLSLSIIAFLLIGTTGCSGLAGLATANSKDPIAQAAEDAVAKLNETAKQNAEKEKQNSTNTGSGTQTSAGVFTLSVDKSVRYTAHLPYNVDATIEIRPSSSSKTFRNADIKFTNTGTKNVSVSWCYNQSTTPNTFMDGTSNIAPGGTYSSWNGLNAGSYYFHYKVYAK